tara:strand:- start:4400 stop:5878 length:1479 start_codon:yes stop_codon:yes gene_type:complete
MDTTENNLQTQLNLFNRGTQYVTLKRPCTKGDGINFFSELEIENYKNEYEKALTKGKKVMKFVPASGAASRMFKHLHNLDSKEGNTPLINNFFSKIEAFPFYNELETKLFQVGIDLSELIKTKSYSEIADKILSEDGLGYADTPKGLVKFHQYESKVNTAFEEHLIEGMKYCKNNEEEINIHFTISEQHILPIKQHIKNAVNKLQKEHKVKFNISFSVQDSSTNTVAVDLVNNPLKDENDDIIFRPGGHGALINNINKLDADIIFIKNIDNVAKKTLQDKNMLYKKALAGRMLELQENVFYALKRLESNRITSKLLNCIELFLEVRFNHTIPESYSSLNTKDRVDYLIAVLNKPIRICGMVKNKGEPGGGPFIVENETGTSKQIIESSQVNLNDTEQARIWNSSTHFNPVDIICSTKDYKGEKFNLNEFVDPNTFFISKKSNNGTELKALEWPGLWNGGMANWLTTFVEVPNATFNPVKTVNDLLKEEHQAA